MDTTLYGISLRETIYTLLESQKEKRGIKRKKADLKESWLRTPQIWEELGHLIL